MALRRLSEIIAEQQKTTRLTNGRFEELLQQRDDFAQQLRETQGELFLRKNMPRSSRRAPSSGSRSASRLRTASSSERMTSCRRTISGTILSRRSNYSRTHVSTRHVWVAIKLAATILEKTPIVGMRTGHCPLCSGPTHHQLSCRHSCCGASGSLPWTEKREKFSRCPSPCCCSSMVKPASPRARGPFVSTSDDM